MSPNLNEAAAAAAAAAVRLLGKLGTVGHASSSSMANGAQLSGGRHVTDLIDSTSCSINLASDVASAYFGARFGPARNAEMSSYRILLEHHNQDEAFVAFKLKDGLGCHKVDTSVFIVLEVLRTELGRANSVSTPSRSCKP